MPSKIGAAHRELRFHQTNRKIQWRGLIAHLCLNERTYTADLFVKKAAPRERRTESAVYNFLEYSTRRFIQGTEFRLRSRIQIYAYCTYVSRGQIVWRGLIAHLCLNERTYTADLFVKKAAPRERRTESAVYNFLEYCSWRFIQGTEFRLRSRIQIYAYCTYVSRGQTYAQ
ncbi:hypothetical protein V5799_009563 [Amblyomma americanum]|uniref:Uncharacterized protein n=1 Tax=Amblyomma americanum TaxID=6943 RepID=A0AAQ4FBA5_AMBAM